MNKRFNKDRACLDCGEIKKLLDFPVTSHICKPCSNAKTALYRANKLNALPSWVNKEQVELIAGMYHLAYDITKQTGVIHQVDHIIPLNGKSVLGLHTYCNLRVITATDNNIKGNSFVG
jgi:hypothetical protein